jgi:hypothetical protein
MNPTIRNILAVIAGLIAGGVVNMAIVMNSGYLVPPPPGADLTTAEGAKAAMHLMRPIHFLMPFLAHALGTMAGAYLAAILAVSHKMKIALGIGVFFLAGGIADVLMYPSPMWFNVLDLVAAYIPVAYLAGRLVVKD